MTKRFVFIVLIISIFAVSCSSADKPSKKELINDLKQVTNSDSANPKETIFAQDAECIINGLYDEFSTTKLNALVGIRNDKDVLKFNESLDKNETNLFQKTIEKCVKPTKENLAIAIQNGKVQKLNLSVEQFKKASKCLVDAIYDEFSNKELKVISNAQNDIELLKLEEKLSATSYALYVDESTRCFSKDYLATTDPLQIIEIAQLYLLRTQISLGDNDYSNFDLIQANKNDENIIFTNETLKSADAYNTIAVYLLNPKELVLQARSDENVCYYMKFKSQDLVTFGMEIATTDTACPLEPVEYKKDSKQGWS